MSSTDNSEPSGIWPLVHPVPHSRCDTNMTFDHVYNMLLTVAYGKTKLDANLDVLLSSYMQTRTAIIKPEIRFISV